MPLASPLIVSFVGRFAVRAATCLAPFVVFLALPPFYNGMWIQVEGVVPWLHAIAALGALGCAVLAAVGDERTIMALRHPLTLIPAAIFALSVVFLPFTALPALSLLGMPEHGFGALAHLDLAALTAAALVTLGDARWRSVVIALALTAVGGAFTLDFLFRDARTWAPLFFGDYLAFYAVFVFAILGVVTRTRPLLFVSAGALGVAMAILSSNKAAILALGGALVLLPVYWHNRSLRTAITLSLFAPIAVSFAIILFGSLWDEAYRGILLRMSGLGPLPAILVDSWASIWSRAMLVVVGAHSFLDAPWRLLNGFGWGHYTESLLTNLSVVQGRLHEHIGPSQVYWDAIVRSDFHSHNQYFEALLASGIAGVALVLSYGAALVTGAPPAQRSLALFVALLLATLQSFWFQMPHTLPLMAIAAAVLVDGSQSVQKSFRSKFLYPTGAAGASAVLLAFAVLSGIISSNVYHERTVVDRGGQAGAFERRFADGLREIYDASLIQWAFVYARKARREGAEGVLQTYLAAATAGEGPRSLKLSISAANVLAGIIFAGPDLEGRFGGYDADFGRAIERVIRMAPRRSDIAIPYFNHLLAAGREAMALDLANLILARNADDAVALWFSGIVLLGQESTSMAGMRNLKRSLIFGIRNMMPIDDQLVRQIER